MDHLPSTEQAGHLAQGPQGPASSESIF